MSKYFRVKVDNKGKAFVIDNEGTRIAPTEAQSIGEKISSVAETPSYVYLGYSEETQLHKIGVSTDPARRAKELDIEIIHTITCGAWGEYSAYRLEALFHRLFTLMGQHREGEYFELVQDTDIDTIFMIDDARNGKLLGLISRNIEAITETLKDTSGRFNLMHFGLILNQYWHKQTNIHGHLFCIWLMRARRHQFRKNNLTSQVRDIDEVEQIYIDLFNNLYGDEAEAENVE